MTFTRPQIFRDAATDGGQSPFGSLPEWDLRDLYESPEAEQLSADLNWLIEETKDFANTFAGKLNQGSAEDLLGAMTRYEKIQTVSGRIMSYAGLRYYQKTTDPDRAAFLADMQEKVTDASAHLVFFSLEMNGLEDTHLQKMLSQNEALAKYRPYLDRLRAMKPHQLSDELEKYLHDQSVVGATAWNRLFDETMAALEFDLDGTTLGLEATLNKLTDAKSANRKNAYDALAKTFAENLPLFSRITNTLAKEKEIEDNWRNLPSPQAARHLSNHVEPEVVDALKEAVTNAYPEISHRYYSLKARWLGVEKLDIWDRNAPLPEQDDATIEWENAKNIVLSAYSDFDPELATLANNFFKNDWIDAAVKDGKAPGAFAHPTVTTVHPYVMLNYMGKTRDVMTLAHELGHGVHQILAAGQGELLASTPLTLAETASVFGEMLTFKKLYAEAPNNVARKTLLAGKVEDMINTVVRQIAFYDFECRLHEKRRSGELKADEINEIWMAVQKESLGPVFNYPDTYGVFWTYIPHFIHSPFYVYAYAFGDGLVNALYAVYENGHPEFEQCYFDLLKAGGSLHHKELLEPFGLDASNPDFWGKGLKLISKMIDELETL